MNEKLEELLRRLRCITVAFVDYVVARDENIISFEGKDRMTVWDDDPSFDSERTRYTDIEWAAADKSYRHYYGFAEYSVTYEHENRIYFQQSDAVAGDLFGFGICRDRGEMLSPPRKGEWIVGTRYVVPKKGPRLNFWTRASKFEVSIRTALLRGKKIDEETIVQMEQSTVSAEVHLVNFARLIVNGDIEYYLDHKRHEPQLNQAEIYTRRSAIDHTVYTLTHEFRPELWQKYEDQSQAEKMFSSRIPAPAPKPIKDNLNGFGESAGLSTPFAALKLAL